MTYSLSPHVATKRPLALCATVWGYCSTLASSFRDSGMRLPSSSAPSPDSRTCAAEMTLLTATTSLPVLSMDATGVSWPNCTMMKPSSYPIASWRPQGEKQVHRNNDSHR